MSFLSHFLAVWLRRFPFPISLLFFHYLFYQSVASADEDTDTYRASLLLRRCVTAGTHGEQKGQRCLRLGPSLSVTGQPAFQLNARACAY
jgi:hypothetical protein